MSDWAEAHGATENDRKDLVLLDFPNHRGRFEHEISETGADPARIDLQPFKVEDGGNVVLIG
jgi:hypothetical protein